MTQHNSFKKDIDMLAAAYGSINKQSGEIVIESTDAPNPVEDDGTHAYKGGNVEHDWASHITAPPFGESIKKILHHNLTEDGIVEEYYVEHNGKLVGVVAESVTIVMYESHSDEEEKEDEEHDEEHDEKAEEVVSENRSPKHGVRPKLQGVKVYK